MAIGSSIFLILATITTVFAIDSASFSAQWKAQAQSDIDTINTDLDDLISSINNLDAKHIVHNIASLTSSVRTATQDVESGPGVNDLAAMAIIFYVQEQMAPKVEEAMSGLVKVKKHVTKAGKRKVVARRLNTLEAEPKKLGAALLFKAPADRQDETQVIIDEIVGDVENAAAAYI
ncbi:hypothetical protein M409DRAFT_29931 [Zasmidium cellare ATCC 36951]|uniref:Fungal N-terminal domain-containing protein n=1 Tax=Zasmidium cellare ATCC 36951 TaxID=1080233 RepID=A0A6A6C1B3_ZASCE|nr:uncharacterized protein M409DRAFT_29931 [Zasmidium cellare ATCC 36951]KAF2159612.1 hypothetical protein M409DRAFT_29931 [Zasmidium cellare ATCC 36951]